MAVKSKSKVPEQGVKKHMKFYILIFLACLTGGNCVSQVRGIDVDTNDNYVFLFDNFNLHVDTSIYKVVPDTFVKYKFYLKEDGSLDMEKVFFYDKMNGYSYKSYRSDGSTYALTEYAALERDVLNKKGVHKNIGTGINYWKSGIIETALYNDKNGLLQGNYIEFRPDGTILKNVIYKDDKPVKTYYYSASGALDSLVVH